MKRYPPICAALALLCAPTAHADSPAPAAWSVPIVTVMDKTLPSPAGDPHNYVSYSRYWWPDPAKPDGLPYVRHDGRHNRAQIARGDHARLFLFITTVNTLAAHWAAQGDDTSARRAAAWLRAWFITPATRMNPNLAYAQIRLGHNGNRGNPPGVLDARDFGELVGSITLLKGSSALSPAEFTSICGWFVAYLHWLTHSPNGRAEAAAKNNHGSWYLAQVIPIARFVGRDALARQLCLSDKARIARQIRPDGSQPFELSRADSLKYSAFNLEAQFRVAVAARSLGIDLWHYTAPDGASLQRALEYLRPYNQHPGTWPHPEHNPLQPGFLDPLIRQAARLGRADSTTWSEFP